MRQAERQSPEPERQLIFLDEGSTFFTGGGGEDEGEAK